MYTLYHAEFQEPDEVLALVILIIISSIVVHGLLAKPAMKWIHRVKKKKDAV